MKIDKNLLKSVLSLDIFRTFGVKIYLLIIFIIVSTTPVIMLGLIQYSFIGNNIITIMENNNLLEVEDFASKIELYADMNARVINLVSQQLENAPEKIKIIFTNILKTYPDFEYIWYENEKGEIFLYDSNFYITDKFSLHLEKYGFMEQARQKNILFFTGKIRVFPDKQPVIGIITPVKTGGYLFGGMKLDKIREYTENISRKKGEAIIVNPVSNSLIYPETENNDFRQLKETIIKRTGTHNSGLIKDYVSDIDGIQKIISYKKMTASRGNSPEWVIWVESPLSAFDEELRKNALRTFAAAIISIGFALVMGLWIAAAQHKFVKNFLGSIRAIAKGNYSKKVDAQQKFIPREFDLLIDEFNFMAERIEQLDSFKSNLIDTVSHEFRTPLTSIKGFSSTLLRKDATFDKETQRKLLKIISNQSDRLSRMVEDLLVVPKLEGHVLKLNLQEIELEQTIEHIVDFFPGQPFEINIEPQLWVMVDPDRLEQVILNLFENAHKYSFPKGAPIKVKASKIGSHAHVIVANSAEKVEPEKLETLFNKFVRLDDTLTRTTGGTGLGLYITKGLIELTGGRIWLEADSEFRVNFTIPIKG
jgi:signal transduction histidine kinase